MHAHIRGPLWCVATASVLGHPGMLGFLAWEYFGTDIVAEHRQDDIRADLRASRQYPTVSDGLASLRPADRVIVETADAVYTYRLDTDPNDLVVPLGQSWVTDPVPIPPKGGCPAEDAGVGLDGPDSGPHHPGNVFGAVPRDSRMVTFGHLVSVTPK